MLGTSSWIRLGVWLIISILSKSTVKGIRITSDPAEVDNKTFSYVVIGGGTAGLTVASRLAEDPLVSILVVEAGPDAQNDTVLNDPGQTVTAPSGFDWQYNTTVQTVGGRSLAMTQGKVLGGSSSVNGMCWTRATIDQYNSFEALGNPGWNFETMLRYMQKSERFHLPNPEQISRGATVNPEVHGFNGNVDAGFPQPYEAAKFAGDAVTAARSAIPGLANNPDVTSGTPNGAARFQYSMKPGNGTVVTPTGNKRSSSAKAYIYPSLQEKPNLTILTGHQATRLLWGTSVDGLSAASGVKFISTPSPNGELGPEFSVTVQIEAIVASGAIGSPHFLELSGIGDSKILQPLGIPVQVNLPAVGTNLQDQALSLNLYAVNPEIPRSDIGVINSPFTVAVAFVDLEQALGKQPAQSASISLLSSLPQRAKEIVASGAFTSEAGILKILAIQARSIISLKAPVLEFSFASMLLPDGAGALTGVINWNLLPQWRGTVHIKSANPNVRPELNPRFFLGSDFDLHLKGNATRLARKMFNTAPLQDYVLAEVSPGLGAVPENATDSQFQDFIKSSYTAVLHPVGSVPMLPRKSGGAVGPDLVVYGTKNVRVVDSSIIPIQLSAHLSSTVYGIAEKAADMIKTSKSKN